jgi:hypothetical protein
MAPRPVNYPDAARLFVGLPDVRTVLCLTPKAGSTSIISALFTHYGIEGPPFHLNPALAVMRRTEVDRHVPTWRRAMFVRNPFARLVANYVYHIKTTNLQNCANMRKLGFKVGMSFEQFLALVLKNTEADPHFSQQCWQMDKPGFVGKVESMAEDWGRFGEFIGADLPPLPQRNRARQKVDYRKFYNKRWREWVEQAYAHDLEAFGYAF